MIHKKQDIILLHKIPLFCESMAFKKYMKTEKLRKHNHKYRLPKQTWII